MIFVFSNSFRLIQNAGMQHGDTTFRGLRILRVSKSPTFFVKSLGSCEILCICWGSCIIEKCTVYQRSNMFMIKNANNCPYQSR